MTQLYSQFTGLRTRHRPQPWLFVLLPALISLFVPWAAQAQSAAAPGPAEFVIQPKLYLLAIGVSQYQAGDVPKRRYPAKDAQDLGDFLRRQTGRLYSTVDAQILTNQQATTHAVLDALGWIQDQTTQHDVAIIFLAGHGAKRYGDYLFLPYNFRQNSIKSTGLPLSYIADTVAHMAGRTLVLLDTRDLGDLGGSPETAESGDQSLTRALSQITGADNGAIVFAGAGRTAAPEDRAWGNGAFTKALVEALRGQGGPALAGPITDKQIGGYVTERVASLTGRQETVIIARPPAMPDLPLAMSPPGNGHGTP